MFMIQRKFMIHRKSWNIYIRVYRFTKGIRQGKLTNDLVKSYLKNRQQFVSISVYHKGPSWSPYVKDMLSSCPNMQLIHYADDTVSCFVKSRSETTKSLVTVQSIICKCPKTSYMIFGNHDLPPGYDFEINNESLSRSETAKFLGIQIDSKLNFKCQTEKV